MSWLRKIVSTVCSSRVEQVVEEVVDAMPTTQCLTAEPALANGVSQENKNPMEPRRYFVKAELVGATPPQSFTAEPALANGADHEDENSTRQRRYFVKTGKWVGNEDEILAAQNGSNGSEEVIRDRHPVDLRTLFPKLSLR